MTNPLKKKLIPIDDLQEIRGVQLPARLKFVQLVVTGPPGAGKTYYINKVHGWPNEGYVDLTRKGWWKDQTLTYKPREVHLGFPFKGYDEALTVFDKEWIDAEVKKFDLSGFSQKTHLPHMGWNDVEPQSAECLFKNIESNARFYFLLNFNNLILFNNSDGRG